MGFWQTVGTEAFAGAIAGITAGILFKIVDWWTSPKLQIYFDPTRTFDKVPAISKDKARQEGGIKASDLVDTLFVHIIVKNQKGRIAEGCRCYVTKLEKLDGETFVDQKIPVHLRLAWSNEGDRCFSALEIPSNYGKRADLFNISINANKFFIFTEPGPRGVPNGFEKGTYRFGVEAGGKNTNRARMQFIVTWNGKFEKDGISVKAVPYTTRCSRNGGRCLVRWWGKNPTG